MNSQIKLKDVATLTVGYVGNMAQEYCKEGVPFFRSLNILPFEISTADMKYISSRFNKKIMKSIFHTNDIVIVRTGNPGTCCVITPEYDGANCSDLVLIRPDLTKTDPIFLSAYIQYNAQKQILNQKVGAIQQHFNIGSAKEMIISFFPDLPVQQQIGRVIHSINSKIALNKRINAELEAMAKTLYDYWFVQFDFPDENGKPYRTSGGAMEYNEQLKREIPRGWSTKKINDLLARTPNTDRIQTTEYQSDGAIPIIDQSSDYIAGYTNLETSRIHTEKGAIVFGDHTRVVKFIGFDFARGADGTQIILSDNPRMPEVLLYHTILKMDLSNYGYARHYKFLKDTSVIVPIKGVAESFESMVVCLNNQIMHKVFENIELTRLRDWMLPMLMNGQATVSDEQPAETPPSVVEMPHCDDSFNLWLQNQGIAARGDLDQKTLREIFGAMDDDDK